jgi:hypothetical protein
MVFAQQWEAIAPMHEARRMAECVTLRDGRLLVAGGTNESNASATCELYNPKTNAWTYTGTMQTPRWAFEMRVLPSGDVIAAGGLTDMNLGTTASCEIYSVASGTWRSTASLAVPTEDFVSLALPDGKIWFMTGLYAKVHQYLSVINQFDPVTETMTRIPDLPIPMWGDEREFLPTLNGVIVVGGGTGGFGGPIYNTTPFFDFATQNWSYLNNMVEQEAGYDFQMVRTQTDDLYVLGGLRGYSEISTNRVQHFDPKTRSWNTAGYLPVGMTYARADFVNQDSILVAGGIGKDSSGLTSGGSCWFNIKTGVGTLGPKEITPRFWFASTIGIDSQINNPCGVSSSIYLLGGDDTNGRALAACEVLRYNSSPSVSILPNQMTVTGPVCETFDTSIALQYSGCIGAQLVEIQSSTPGVGISALMQLPVPLSTSGLDTIHLAIGELTDSTVLTFVVANGSDTLRQSLIVKRSRGSAGTAFLYGYLGTGILNHTLTYPLGVKFYNSLNIDSLVGVSSSIRYALQYDTSDFTFLAVIPPSGWTMQSENLGVGFVDVTLSKTKSSTTTLDSLGEAVLLVNSLTHKNTSLNLSSLEFQTAGGPLPFCLEQFEGGSWQIKLDSASAGVAQRSSSAGFQVSDVYPNPAGSTAQIKIRTDYPASVSIRIFDILGREMHDSEIRSVLAVDEQLIPLSLTAYHPGTYYVRVETGGKVETRKLVIGE